MSDVDEKAKAIAARLREYAYPDSRFDLDFSCFIPGFLGSKKAALALRNSPAYQAAPAIFCTLEASLWEARQFALEDGKDVIMPTYGLSRGIFHLEANSIRPEERAFATCLDGLELFGEPVSPKAQFDFKNPSDNLFICGASAIAKNGVRFGMGAFYIDVEWWIAKGLSIIGGQSPVFSIIHDVQLSDLSLEISPDQLVCDAIFTPTQSLKFPNAPRPSKPPELNVIQPDLLEIAIVQQFLRL